MKSLTKLFIATLLCLVAAMPASAQETVSKTLSKTEKAQLKALEQKAKKDKKKAKQIEKVDTRRSETYTTTVYMFGIAAEFGDSVVYAAEIQPVDSARLTRKFDYLADRSDYSFQFSQHLSQSYGCSNLTTAVFFDKDKKKLTKRYAKVMKKYTTKRNLMVRFVSPQRFVFQVPKFQILESDSETDTP